MNWYLEALMKEEAFSGRARRKEYWMFTLLNSVIVFGLSLIDELIGSPGVIGALYSVAVLIPSIAVSVRRLHDTDRSGWWLLIAFIPIVGIILLLIFMVQDSKSGQNQYGDNPKDITA